MNQKIVTDIEKHFHSKLRRLLIDTAEVCEIAEINQDDMIGLVIPSLIYEISTAALALEMTEKQFVHLCLSSFRATNLNFTEAYEAAQRYH